VRPGARIQAAADVIEDILVRHQPASAALQDWGKRHRFAGSGDRAAIGTLVFDALRQRLSLAARMGSETPRALAIAAAPAALEGKTELDAIVAYLQGLGTAISNFR